MSRSTGVVLGVVAFLSVTAMLGYAVVVSEQKGERWRRTASLGRNYAFQGRDEEAIRAFERALDEAARGSPAGMEVAFTLNELAPVYLRNGRTADARDAATRALALIRAAKLPDRAPEAQSLRHLGEAAAADGATSEALSLLRESAAIWERREGQGSMNLVEVRASLGYVLLADGSDSAAEDEFRRAMSGWERATAGRVPPHPPSLLGQALCLLARGDVERADPILDRAAELIERQAGRENIHWARVLAGRAERHRLRGELAGAREELRTAIALVERHMGARSPEAQRLRERLAAMAARGS
jgi:tetratricopeptide (TPR) repeat protein